MEKWQMRNDKWNMTLVAETSFPAVCMVENEEQP